MPTWILIPILLMVAWIIVGLVLLGSKGWLLTPLFTTADIMPLGILGTICGWLITTLIYGVLFLAFTNETEAFLTPFLILVVVPILGLLGISTFIILERRRYYVSKSHEQKLIDSTILVCKEWLSQFSFVNNDMYDIQLYFSHGRVTGRLKINHLKPHEASLIESKANEVPPGVYLSVLCD